MRFSDEPDEQAVGTEPDQVDAAVYSWVLEHHRLEPAPIASQLGLDPDSVAASVRRLTTLRLLYPDPQDSGAGYAVAPETAMSRLAAPVEARVRRQQEELAKQQAQLAGFFPHYQRGRQAADAGEGIEVIATLQEVRAALDRASDNCRSEVLASQPGGGSRVPEAMQEALGRDRALLARGVRMRTLYL
ncbi:hypothetical protein [Streptomyces sp. NPDC048496]|uniref:hypothetical protein n=1 Tax=Streptomyces sp. NPDC048496 TaxID=3365558 RepID=UPI003710AC37